MTLILNLLQDAFFAALAAIGFASESTPPLNAFKFCALIAAVGHSTRYLLMNVLGWHIVLASFVAAVVIGMLAIFIAPKVKCPPETFAFPSLLPMIPGIYAYHTVQALVLCVSTNDEAVISHYSSLLIYNGLICTFVIACMVVGAVVPIFSFKRLSFSATRS